LKDAPCVGRQLQLALTVRKFLCQNPDCSRKVFTERIPDLAEPWARMTTRLKEQITSIGLATSGKAGVRLGDRLPRFVGVLIPSMKLEGASSSGRGCMRRDQVRHEAVLPRFTRTCSESGR